MGGKEKLDPQLLSIPSILLQWYKGLNSPSDSTWPPARGQGPGKLVATGSFAPSPLGPKDFQGLGSSEEAESQTNSGRQRRCKQDVLPC